MIRVNDGILVSWFGLNLISRNYKSRMVGASTLLKEFKLKKNKLYDVALDQSNTCTGMTIRSVDEDVLYILELINNDVSFPVYRKALLYFLKTLLSGVDVRYFLMEEPLGFMTGRRNAELTTLKHTLMEFVENTKGLNISKFDRISPQSWRAGLIKKDNPEPKNSKLACVVEIIKLYPETANLKPHKKLSGTDYDGFESCGILCGYINRHQITNKNDLVKIVGPINTTKQGFGIFFRNDSDLENVINLIMGLMPKLGEPKIKFYNEDNTLYENVKMSLVDDFTLSVVNSELARVSLCHLFGENFLETKTVMIVIPAASLKDNFIKAVVDLGANCEIFY